MKRLDSVNAYIILLLLFFSFTSCKKYLDAKSDARLSTPSTLADMQAILDNDFEINAASTLLNESTDEYYLDFATWDFQAEGTKQGYIWQYAPETEENTDWQKFYKNVFYVNTILDNLPKINQDGQLQKWNTIKGSALFLRAYYFFVLSQVYAPQYDSNTASTDLGLPLRLSSDFNKPTTRATVKQTYERVIQDLDEAIGLLPNDAGHKTRPSKPAGYALSARVYLQMGNYAKARENADACLKLNSTLLDFNTVPNSPYPFTYFVPEVLFHTKDEYIINAFDFFSKTDSINYASYASDDLRRELFFEDGIGSEKLYAGSYNGAYIAFNGLATDEVYLIKAEANARLGDTADALKDLNTLLTKRWKDGMFVPYTASNADEALTIILQERKKELLNRGTRWSDLKRLNKEQIFAVTLKRELNGEIFTLPPNDLRYTFLIPKNVIQLTGIQQNPR
jgi:starch-binding outer membrane protein, SusD/RagB family